MKSYCLWVIFYIFLSPTLTTDDIYNLPQEPDKLNNDSPIQSSVELSSTSELLNQKIKSQDKKKDNISNMNMKNDSSILLKSSNDHDENSDKPFLPITELIALKNKERVRDLKDDKSIIVQTGTEVTKKIKKNEDKVDISAYFPKIKDLNHIMEIKPNSKLINRRLFNKNIIKNNKLPNDKLDSDLISQKIPDIDSDIEGIPMNCSPEDIAAGKCRPDLEVKVKKRIKNFIKNNKKTYKDFEKKKTKRKSDAIEEAKNNYYKKFEENRQNYNKLYQDDVKSITDVYHKQKQQIWDDDVAHYKKQRNNNKQYFANQINHNIKKTIRRDIKRTERIYKQIRKRQIKELTRNMVRMYKKMYKEFDEHEKKKQEYYSIAVETNKDGKANKKIIENSVHDEGDALL